MRWHCRKQQACGWVCRVWKIDGLAGMQSCKLTSHRWQGRCSSCSNCNKTAGGRRATNLNPRGQQTCYAVACIRLCAILPAILFGFRATHFTGICTLHMQRQTSRSFLRYSSTNQAARTCLLHQRVIGFCRLVTIAHVHLDYCRCLQSTDNRLHRFVYSTCTSSWPYFFVLRKHGSISTSDPV